MKRINIFKAGTHTDSTGTKLEFTEDMLKAAVSNYAPSIHEAPIVVGHPTTNGPAWGWIEKLEYSDGNIYAIPKQVNAEFSDQVQQGLYKKVSASWYLPDAPNNPSPGALSLRHVGFLGAQPPAVKGLEPIQFEEHDEETIEFSDNWAMAEGHSMIANTFKALREFIIDKFSKEDADQIIPSYVSEELARNAEYIAKQQSESDEASNPLYNEGNTVTLEELQAANATLQASNDAKDAENLALKSQVSSFEEAKATARKAEIALKVDALITSGKATPAQRPQLIAFAEALEGTGATIEFGEGDDKRELNSADALIDFLSKGKNALDFQERSQDENEPSTDDLTAQQIAIRARDFAEKNGVSIQVATNHVMKSE
jgi:hypothetical protein